MKDIRQRIILTICTYSIFQVVYLLLFYFCDFTFWGTANGAYKALNYYDWANNNGVIEKGNLLYYPLIKTFTSIFALKTPLEIYNGIVLINGFFSSCLLAYLFWYFSNYFQSIRIAVAIVLVHFLLMGNFVLSINNEDIFPSYALFVVGALLYNDFIQKGSSIKLICAAFAFSVSMLLHWTSGIPAFAAVFMHLLFFTEDKFNKRIKNIVLVCSVSVLCFLIISACLDIPFLKIVYPAKEAGSLWVSGFEFEKVVLGVINTPIFLFYGTTALHFSDIMNNMGLLFLFTLFPLSVIIFFSRLLILFRRSEQLLTWWRKEKRFIYFLSIIFIIGLALNIYEQGSDPQFFIQPGFFFLYLGIIFTRMIPFQKIKVQLYVFFGIIISLNVVFLVFFNHYDSKFFNEYAVVKNNVTDMKKTLFIGSPFEVLHIVIQLKTDDRKSFHYLPLPAESEPDYLLSDKEYIDKQIGIIEEHIQTGYAIVVIDLVNKPAVEAGTTFVGYDLTKKMEGMQTYFKDNFSSKEIPGTGDNSFFVLKKL